jgi:hypothetical protein
MAYAYADVTGTRLRLERFDACQRAAL